MANRNYFSFNAFVISLFLPLLAIALMFWMAYLFDPHNKHPDAMITIYLIVLVGILITIGWQIAKQAMLPPTLFGRLWPLAAPAWLLLLTIVLFWQIRKATNVHMNTFYLICLAVTYLPFWSAFLVRSEIKTRSTQTMRGAAMVLAIFLLVGIVMVATWSWLRQGIIPADIQDDTSSIGHGVLIEDYMPFHDDNRLVKPASEPTFHIENRYPRLDGAIAMLPIYAAAAQAVYKGLDRQTVNEYVECTNTPSAYRRLADGEADVFVGLGPSRQQQEYAESNGLTLVRTPIAREAFVFMTHKDNSIDNLTMEQIRAIYTRKITNWSAVGGDDKQIIPFQRSAGSGSQTVMEKIVMQGQAMAKPLREEDIYGMGDLVRYVADYRNRENSLGYSFRWYATTQFPSNDIKLLSIDGIAPTVENIASGRYPLTVDIEAVTARQRSEETQALIDWLTGPEGQDLIRRTGYVPLSRTG